MKAIRIAEFRSLDNNEKGLEEKRVELIDEMDSIINKVEAETRTLTDKEESRIDEIEKEVEKIDKTIQILENKRTLGVEKGKKKKQESEQRTQDEINNSELRSILSGKEIEERATAMNTTTGAEGGVVVNKVLSKNIIKTIKDRSNVYKFFDGTNIKGNYKIPKKITNGTAEWVDENPAADPSATIATLEIIELGQHRLYRESAITKQMLNVQELDLQAFIKDDIAESMTDAIETAIFHGSGTKQPTGIISGIKTANQIKLETRGAFSVDHLKKAKAKLKKSIVKKARWFMNSETFLEIDLLKDADGRPLLQPNPTQETDYILLGLPVELTDALESPSATGAKCLIVLATPAAYHTNTQASLALYVYNDSVYTRRGLVGYGADIFLDGKTKDDQQVVGIYNKA
nr:phage major capsid protein [uncultured Clostridium sp.]